MVLRVEPPTPCVRGRWASLITVVFLAPRLAAGYPAVLWLRRATPQQEEHAHEDSSIV